MSKKVTIFHGELTVNSCPICYPTVTIIGVKNITNIPCRDHRTVPTHSTFDCNEAELRDEIAGEIEAGRRLRHQTHAIPYCPNCHANDVRDEVAKEIRGLL